MPTTLIPLCAPSKPAPITEFSQTPATLLSGIIQKSGLARGFIVPNTPRNDDMRHIFSWRRTVDIQPTKSGTRQTLEDKKTAYIEAARDGNVKAMRLLLLDGRIDPLMNNQEAYRLAAAHGRTHGVQFLQSHYHANPIRDDYSAMRLAMINGHKATATAMVDGLLCSTKQWNEVLDAAIEHNHLPTVNRLKGKSFIDMGQTWPNDRGYLVNSKLELASVKGHLPIVKSLLSVSDFTTQSAAAFHAAKNGHWSVVNYLMKANRSNLSNAIFAGAAASGDIEDLRGLISHCQSGTAQNAASSMKLKKPLSIPDLEALVTTAAHHGQHRMLGFLFNCYSNPTGGVKIYHIENLTELKKLAVTEAVHYGQTHLAKQLAQQLSG